MFLNDGDLGHIKVLVQVQRSCWTCSVIEEEEEEEEEDDDVHGTFGEVEFEDVP